MDRPLPTRFTIDEATGATNSLRVVFQNPAGAYCFVYVIDSESRNLLLHRVHRVRAEQDILNLNELADMHQTRFFILWIWWLDWHSVEG